MLVLIAGELNRHTGPGLVESVYEQCLCHESRVADIPFERQVAIPIGEAFKVDIVVASEVILEIKPVAAILPVHEAQQHTYPRMSCIRIGLILNFNARRLTEGIRRYVL